MVDTSLQICARRELQDDAGPCGITRRATPPESHARGETRLPGKYAL